MIRTTLLRKLFYGIVTFIIARQLYNKYIRGIIFTFYSYKINYNNISQSYFMVDYLKNNLNSHEIYCKDIDNALQQLNDIPHKNLLIDILTNIKIEKNHNIIIHNDKLEILLKIILNKNYETIALGIPQIYLDNCNIKKFEL